MKHNKFFSTILLSTLLLFISSSIEIVAKNSIKKDEVLEYAFEKFKSTKSESKENYLHSLALLYINFGNNDDALSIFKILEDEYFRYSIIFSIYDQNNSLSVDLLKKLTRAERDIKDRDFELDILLIKASYFLKKKDESYYAILVTEFHKIIEKIKCIENHLPFQLLLQVAELLYDNGLKKEAQIIWENVHDKSSSYKICGNFSSIIDIIKSYNHICNIKERNQLITEISNHVFPYQYYQCQFKLAFYLCMAVYNFQSPVNFNISLINSLKFWREISTIANKTKCLSNLFSKSITEYVEIINQVKVFERILTQRCDFILERESFSAVKNFIEFLIQKNQYMKGKDIFLRLITQKKDFKKRKYFSKFLYAFLINDYIQSNELTVNSTELLEMIEKNPTQAITQLIQLSESLNPIDDKKQLLQIIDLLMQVHIQDIFDRDRQWGNISIVCLKKRYFKKALEIIAKINNSKIKSILIYEVAQVFAKENKLSEINGLLTNYKLENDIEAYILSTIASRLMINSRQKEAVKIFKKSIDLLSNSKCGDFNVIFKNYYNAKVKGKFLESNAWPNMTMID